jgi:hypothetical protein
MLFLINCLINSEVSNVTCAAIELTGKEKKLDAKKEDKLLRLLNIVQWH